MAIVGNAKVRRHSWIPTRYNFQTGKKRLPPTAPSAMTATSAGTLVIGFLLDDMATGGILCTADLSALFARDHDIGLGAALQLGDACLLGPEVTVLAISQRAVAVATFDLAGLFRLPAINPRRIGT